MGEAIFDLEHVLRSNKDQLTVQEVNIMKSWRTKATRDLTIGAASGSIVTWLATRRLRNVYRVNLTLGVAAACGICRFGKSIESSVEQILSLEGSRIQHTLANILLKKYQNDPWVLPLLSKHFCSEEVYDDSSVDRPILRWRFRNFSGDPITRSQPASYSEGTDSKENDVKKTTIEPQQVYVNTVGEPLENPFDLIFGLPEKVDVPHPDSPRTPSKLKKRKEKRSRRRHRRHHDEEDSDI